MLYQTKMIDEMMRGLVSTPMEFMDQFMSGEITNHLFEEKNIPKSGLDLAALNIQRGRDHGLKSYNAYRVACNLKRAHNFDDLAGEINQVRLSSKDEELDLDSKSRCCSQPARSRIVTSVRGYMPSNILNLGAICLLCCCCA